MKRIKFLQTGDLHIGRGRVVMGEKATLERGALLLDTLYQVAREQKCSGLLVTGDIFDVKDVTNHERELVASKFVANAGRDGLPTYVIAGNHDQTTKNSGNLDFLAEIAKTGEVPNLHVSFATTEAIWSSPVEGLSIIGAPCSKSEDQRWVESFVKALPTDQQYIFMGHGTIRGCVRNDQGWKPTDEEDSKKLSLHAAALSAPHVVYWAYGDIHKLQKLPSLPEGHHGWYAGSPIQMDFGEQPDRGVLIVALDKGDNGWSYTGKKYIRLDTEDSGFAPFVVVTDADQLEGLDPKALIKIDKSVVLSTAQKEQVVRTFKVIEDRATPQLEGEDAVVVGTQLEAVDPLLSNLKDVQEDVLKGFKPTTDLADVEARRVVDAAVTRFQARTYTQ